MSVLGPRLDQARDTSIELIQLQVNALRERDAVQCDLLYEQWRQHDEQSRLRLS